MSLEVKLEAKSEKDKKKKKKKAEDDPGVEETPEKIYAGKHRKTKRSIEEKRKREEVKARDLDLWQHVLRLRSFKKG